MPFDLTKTIRLLSATPGTLRALLSDLAEDWTESSADLDSWSAFDVVGHLIHGEETDWIPRARIILEQGEELTFAAFDRVAQFKRSNGKTLPQLLDEFETLRRRNLETISAWLLTDDQLELFGIHPELGPVTLRQLLATWPVHDLTHLRQIANYLAGIYKDEVGPWREYLSILK